MSLSIVWCEVFILFQVTVVHINATSKNAADDKLRQSLRRFAQSYPPPATVVLVSGDINFAAELSDLRHRHNLTVICLHNAQAQSALLACAHESKRFDLFTDELPVTAAQTKVCRLWSKVLMQFSGNLNWVDFKNHLKKRFSIWAHFCMVLTFSYLHVFHVFCNLIRY